VPAALYFPGRLLVPFLLEAESTQDHNAAGRVRSIEKSSDLIGDRIRGLPACNIVPQGTALPLARVTLELLSLR
jgi:hypothetical protein